MPLTPTSANSADFAVKLVPMSAAANAKALSIAKWAAIRALRALPKSHPSKPLVKKHRATGDDVDDDTDEHASA